MKSLVFATFIALSLTSCSSEESTTNEETAAVNVIPDRVLTVEIDGMVCEMGCGASIRKELAKLDGVSAVEFDFEEERKTNMAQVSFDKDKISAEAIVKAISGLNDGQFSVGKTSSENLDKHHVHQTNEVSNEDPQAEVKSTYIKLPNLLDFLSEII